MKDPKRWTVPFAVLAIIVLTISTVPLSLDASASGAGARSHAGTGAPQHPTAPSHVPIAKTLPPGFKVDTSKGSVEMPGCIGRCAVVKWVDAPNGDIDVGGNTFMLIDTDRTVGNITVRDNAVLYIHNVSRMITTTQYGNLVLKDNATFALNNSRLYVMSHYNFEYQLSMYGRSKFLAVLANVTSNGVQWGGALNDDSNLTVIGTYFCYTPSWFPVTMMKNSSLFVYYSYFFSDVVIFDSVYIPTWSRMIFDNSGGFNIWLNFKVGSKANITLPGMFGQVAHWEFPKGQNVSGLNYTVSINNSFVMVFAVMLWKGCEVTVHDSPSFLTAFFIDFTSTAFSGLKEQYYKDFKLSSAVYNFRLLNSTIYTWNFYPLFSTVRIDNCTIGEVLVMEGSDVEVRNSNLTNHGGFVSVQKGSKLKIFDSKISTLVVNYDNSTMRIENTTIDTPYPSQITVIATSVTTLVDVAVGSNTTMQVLDSAVVNVEWSLGIEATKGGMPAPSTKVNVTWSPNGTLAATGVTDANGSARFVLLEKVITASGSTLFRDYRIVAMKGFALNETSIQLSNKVKLKMELVDLIVETNPTDGSTNVSTSQYIIIRFGPAMNESSVNGSISIRPSQSLIFSWHDPQELWLHHWTKFKYQTEYTINIPTSAMTQSGIVFPSNYSFSFTTGLWPPPSPPKVLNTNPYNGSANISLDAYLSISFDKPMDTLTTLGAIASTPTIPWDAVWNTDNDTLTLKPAIPLKGNTEYTITISTLAKSADGAYFASPYIFSFTTVIESDKTPPTVTSTYPADGAKDVEITSKLFITFSKPMDKAATEGAVSVSTATITAKAWIDDNQTLVLTVGLEEGTSYVVHVTTGAKDVAGNALSKEYSFSFMTKGNSTASGYTMLLIGIGIAIAVIVVLAILLMKRRRGKAMEQKAEKEGAETPTAERPGQ